MKKSRINKKCLIILIFSLIILISPIPNAFSLRNEESRGYPIEKFTYSHDFSKVIDPITGLKSELMRWDKVALFNPSYEIDNILSYQKDALVKVREDNKIEFVVQREESDFTPQQIEFFSRYNIEIYDELPYFNSSIIYIPLSFNGQSIYSFLDELTEIPGISFFEPNFYDQLAYVPNDALYASDQWDMPLIGMETAWNYQLGSHNVKVAVIDSGINYNHPELQPNYLPLGYDWVNSDNDPMDDRDHGSHCAGTIAAVTGNTIGVAGMAQVSIFAEKVFDAAGSGSHANFRSGMIHAVDQGADIISYSGGGSDSTTKKEGVDYAINHGVMVIAAAGNDDVNTPFYPAAYPDVIAVAATDQNDLKASFSNYGTWIDIAAPGVDITSTGLSNTDYRVKSGTSMACPHVSGLAALIKSEYPGYTSTQIENIIKSNAVDLGTPGFDVYFGWGRIDAHNLFVNNAPNSPINPYPLDGATGVSINPILTVDVSDTNADSMDVSFYDASDDSLIGTENDVSDGGTASVVYAGLSENTGYSWYAVADDGIDLTQSSTWSFTTTTLLPTWSFHDDISSNSWQLIDVSNEFFYETFRNEDVNDNKVSMVYVNGASFYSDTNYNGDDYAIIGEINGYMWSYVKVSSNLNSLYLTDNDGPASDILVLYGAFTYFLPSSNALQTDLKFDVSTTSSFDLNSITWNNKPGVGSLLVNDFPFYQYSSYDAKYINLGVRDQSYFVLTPSTTKSGYTMSQCTDHHWYSWAWPELQKHWGKFYQGNG
ncbi:MAG: S8 family serine peptidase, partial [Promethearchaeota archaeon]